MLQSSKDKHLYVGCTENLKIRFKQHNRGKVEATKSRVPLVLVYYEACKNFKDARRREQYLKTTYGHRYIKSRLKSYFTG